MLFRNFCATSRCSLAQFHHQTIVRHHSNAATASPLTAEASKDAKEGFVSYEQPGAPQAAHSPWARNLMLDLSREHVLSIYRQLLAESNKLPTRHQRMFVQTRIRKQFRANKHLPKHSDDHIMHVRVAMSHIDDIKAKVQHFQDQLVLDDRLSQQEQDKLAHEAQQREQAQREKEFKSQQLESWKEDEARESQPRAIVSTAAKSSSAASATSKQHSQTAPDVAAAERKKMMEKATSKEEFAKAKQKAEEEYLQETGWRSMEDRDQQDSWKQEEDDKNLKQ